MPKIMSSRSSTIITLLGFLSLILGMLSLVLSMSSINISGMQWIGELLGRGGALLVHLCMVVVGIVAIVAARGNFSGEDPSPITKTES